MKFRNYCVVIIGDTLGSQDEIIKISETKPNILDGKGLLIATFSSIAEPNEITEWFKQNNRSFLVFDLDKNSSGFNITKPHIHEGLFGFLNTLNMDDMNNSFAKAIELSAQTNNVETQTKPIVKKNIGLDEKEIKKMRYEERQDLLNKLIENGLEKLSEDDKKLLPLLVI